MRFTGRVFRAHNPRWSFTPLSSDGAALHGGRFNPVGTGALYTSLRMETAWLEAQQGFPFKPQPLTICAYDVDSEPVLDLTGLSSLNDLDFSPVTLACPWEDLADQGKVLTAD
ncbi:RES family NAD+ phosphorylase [Gluconobacter potus]|uniref:RES family NAD+ phosphorylase n=1 Tax=Gluconobacter potus TaxID=2724927 RepID=UPI0039E908B7